MARRTATANTQKTTCTQRGSSDVMVSDTTPAARSAITMMIGMRLSETVKSRFTGVPPYSRVGLMVVHFLIVPPNRPSSHVPNVSELMTRGRGRALHSRISDSRSVIGYLILYAHHTKYVAKQAAAIAALFDDDDQALIATIVLRRAAELIEERRKGRHCFDGR